MPIIKIPSALQSYADGQKSVIIEGATIKEVVVNLTKNFPGLKHQILDPEGNLRAFVNLYLGNVNVKDLKEKHNAIVSVDDIIVIIASISGG
jgi:molybdopterin converting factor small subunit